MFGRSQLIAAPHPSALPKTLDSMPSRTLSDGTGMAHTWVGDKSYLFSHVLFDFYAHMAQMCWRVDPRVGHCQCTAAVSSVADGPTFDMRQR